jgi:hypothetical protein
MQTTWQCNNIFTYHVYLDICSSLDSNDKWVEACLSGYKEHWQVQLLAEQSETYVLMKLLIFI